MDEETIFLKAVEIDSPKQRAAFLEEACGDDKRLRRGVETLLRHHNDAGNFLEKPPAALVATITTGELGAGNDNDCDVALDFLKPSDKPGCLGTLGPYEVIEIVGRGGMGLVLRAYDTKLNRVVAIKVMVSELAANPMAVKRFVREARAAAAVSHDHVITIHAIEEDHRPPFIVMEFIDGLSLQEKIDRDGALELKEILRIGMQMAAGLAAAHKQGLVHRDIKPANIVLENSIERVKITDFGLARAVDDVSVTQTGQIAGTPQFMSPEQAQGHSIDGRSDLFSLGSVLYTMCTGRPPFLAETAVAMLRRVTDNNPRPIRAAGAEIPDWLEAIVFKLLAKEPDERFQSADEVAELLSQHLAHLQHPSMSSMPPPVVPPKRTAALQPDGSNKLAQGQYGRTTSSRSPIGTVIKVFLAVFALMFLAPAAAVLFWFSSSSQLTPREDMDIFQDRFNDKTQPASGDNIVKTLEPHPGQSNSVGTNGQAAENNSTLIHRFSGHPFGMRGQPSLSPDTSLLAAHGPDSVRVWEIKTGKQQNFVSVDSVACGVAFLSQEPRRIAIGMAGGEIRIWNLTLNQHERTLTGHVGDVHALAVSPDENTLAAASVLNEKGDAKLWNLTTFESVTLIEEPTWRVIFMPDGEHLITSSRGERGTVRIWDAKTHRATKTLTNVLSVRHRIEALAVSPDGKRLAVGGGNWRTKSGELVLFDLASQDTPMPVLRHHSEIADFRALDFSTDGRWLAVGAPLGRAIILDANTFQEAYSFTAYTYKQTPAGRIIGGVAFMDGGKKLLTTAETENACLWRLPEQLWTKKPLNQE